MPEEIEIDPYIPRLPLDRYVDNDGRLTLAARNRIEYQDKVIHDIILGIRINQTNVTNITSSETFETSQSAGQAQELFERAIQIEGQIPDVHVVEFKTDIVTSNRTAVNRDFFDVRSGSTITLDSKAQLNDQIITSIGDSSGIKVKSDIEIRYKGKRANEFIFRREGTSAHWYLFSSGTEKYWRAS